MPFYTFLPVESPIFLGLSCDVQLEKITSVYLAKAFMQYQRAKESYFEGKLPENYLFVSNHGKKFTQEGIAKWLKKAAKEVGVNCDIRVSPHTCRHTFAHLELKNGIDLYTLSRLIVFFIIFIWKNPWSQAKTGVCQV